MTAYTPNLQVSAYKIELPSKENSAGEVMLAGLHTSKALPELTTIFIFKILLCLLNSKHIAREISYNCAGELFFEQFC